ncbi:MAG TPA: lytic transglycosylase domain-containing protein [Actinomycetota bacterium]
MPVGPSHRPTLASPPGRASPTRRVEPSPSPPPSGSPSPEPEPSRPPEFVPDPDTPIPSSTGPLASLLARTTFALQDSIRRWARHRGAFEAPPRALVFQALLQQRIYRVLGRDAALARNTVAALPARLRVEASTTADAVATLFSLVHPVPSAAPFRTQPPEPAGALLGYYREAEGRFGVDWEVLAAVNFVESKFGRVRSTSTAGAQGPMQFLPSTWSAYGLGGDVHDPHDAILGAANYLHASGAPGDVRRALFEYNHADEYVDAVLLYAGQLRRDPRTYFEYYNWQVFVVTTRGDVRITGPA